MTESDRKIVERILAIGINRALKALREQEERKRLTGILELHRGERSALRFSELRQLEQQIATFRAERVKGAVPAIFLAHPSDDEPRISGLLRVLAEDEILIANRFVEECCAGDREWDGVLDASEVAELRAIERKEPGKK